MCVERNSVCPKGEHAVIRSKEHTASRDSTAIPKAAALTARSVLAVQRADVLLESKTVEVFASPGPAFAAIPKLPPTTRGATIPRPAAPMAYASVERL